MMEVPVLLLFAFLCLASATQEPRSFKCLKGRYHKKFSSSEVNLVACHRYSQNTCCSRPVTEEIASAEQKIGNFSWNLCGDLSPSCNKYFRRMECFYQCEPYLSFWERFDKFSSIYRVPICSDFCDSWFEACKNDLTCVGNWITQFKMEKGWKNKCPEGSQCNKFSKFFVNGKHMCQTMWGDSLQYAKEICFDVDFEGHNPNWQVVTKTLEKENIGKTKLEKKTAGKD